MPKIIKEKSAFFIIPALIIIIGAVFLFVKKTESATEWEKDSAPPYVGDLQITDIKVHYNPTDRVYNAWAVGQQKSGETAVAAPIIFKYDGKKHNWSDVEIPEKEGASTFDYYLWALDYYWDEQENEYTLWAVGIGGYIIKYGRWLEDEEPYWGYLCNGCENGIWSEGDSNWFSSTYYDIDFLDSQKGWIAGGGNTVYQSNNGGSSWGISSKDLEEWVGFTGQGIDMISENEGWVSGIQYSESTAKGALAKWNGENWVRQADLGIKNLRDIDFADSNHGWAVVYENYPDADPPNNPLADIYYYYNGTSWSSGNTGINYDANKITAVKDPATDEYHVWFAGDDGKILYSKDNANWVEQTTETSTRLYSICAVNPSHAWAVGAEALILKLSPGNISGWGYVGADNCDGACTGLGCGIGNCKYCSSSTEIRCAEDSDCPLLETCNDSGVPTTMPAGWISFSCVNQENYCDEVEFSYAVNIKRKTADDCAEDSQDKDVGALSGYAWFGTSDIYQLPPGVTCNEGVCSNNEHVGCIDDSDCACAYNYASCYSSGWLTFSRNDALDDPENESLPGPPYQSLPFTTPCDKEIKYSDPENYVMATFDYDTYALEGWARFMTGVCTDDLNKACFKDGDCDNNDCNHNGQGRCTNDWATSCIDDIDCETNGPCYYPRGWVKLRGGTHIDDPDTIFSSYIPCQACFFIHEEPDPGDDPTDLNEFDGDESMVCKICDGLLSSNEKYMCNNCGITDISEGLTCGTGRCSFNEDKLCIYDSAWDICDSDDGACKQVGYCSNNSALICGDDSVCGTGECIFSNICKTCEFCDQYGVSVDIDAGDWYGYAYSDDFGWLDLSQVGMYNTAWIRSQYGDIYSRGSIGSPQTARAPGYTYAERDCNATYLLLAHESVINFCSEANRTTEYSFRIPDDTFNPYVVEGYRAFNLPKSPSEEESEEDSTASPHSILGTIDYNKLINKVDAENLFEEDVTALSLFNAYSINLGGEIYRVTKNLDFETITSSGQMYEFKAQLDSSGAGLIIVDGDFSIYDDIKYNDTGADSLAELPSLGFYVKGDIIIGANVESIVGSYYCEGKIIVQSTNSRTKDRQLKVNGLMIASQFDFRRLFKGTINIPQPAEIITYDGRIQLNPPPGFRDLQSALPKIRPANP